MKIKVVIHGKIVEVDIKEIQYLYTNDGKIIDLIREIIKELKAE